MNQVTLTNLSLDEYGITDRVKSIRDAYFEAIPEICTERPRLITDCHLNNKLLGRDRISILEKAKAYSYYLENRKPVVWHTEAYDKDCKQIDFTDESLCIEDNR